ncbi:MAG TPA: hypothetical protein VGI93_16480, partial [Steroidobacteraceae bacterium]
FATSLAVASPGQAANGEDANQALLAFFDSQPTLPGADGFFPIWAGGTINQITTAYNSADGSLNTMTPILAHGGTELNFGGGDIADDHVASALCGISVCTTWTPAVSPELMPELSPGAMGTALVILFAGLAILKGRRSLTAPA